MMFKPVLLRFSDKDEKFEQKTKRHHVELDNDEIQQMLDKLDQNQKSEEIQPPFLFWTKHFLTLTLFLILYQILKIFEIRESLDRKSILISSNLYADLSREYIKALKIEEMSQGKEDRQEIMEVFRKIFMKQVY